MNLLVAGATGAVGRPLVEQLLAGGHRVRALTRNPQAHLPAGAELVVGDLTRPETLAPALAGVHGLHLINFSGEGALLETGSEIVALAEHAGVQRVTVLTGGQKSSVEQAVEASRLAWTRLEPVEFMNGALDWAPAIRAGEPVRQPFADRQTAAVHPADIAAVAASVLTGDRRHAGQAYTLTGPAVLTPRAMVCAIGAALGRAVEFIELTPEAAQAEWRAAGQPEALIEFMLWVYGDTPAVGYTVTPTVAQVTGRPPRTFAQWVAENIAAFGG